MVKSDDLQVLPDTPPPKSPIQKLKLSSIPDLKFLHPVPFEFLFDITNEPSLPFTDGDPIHKGANGLVIPIPTSFCKTVVPDTVNDATHVVLPF